jgi:Zn-dependent M28 family amino/carboxypeptidase
MIATDTMTASCPSAAPIDLSWLATYQMDVLGRLTGKTPYAPGKSLANRGTTENRKIAAQLLGQMLTDLQLTPQAHLYGTGSNVYAVLPSTTGNPERVVVGAHYDTVTNTPGASDNASGVAAVLATARAMTQLGCRTRSLIFVLFDQEEVGLVGSAAYADKLAADAVPVHSVHSIDQLGWDEDQDHLIELERGDPDIRQLYQNAVTALGIDVPLSATRTGSTDHESFRPRFKAIGVTEEYAGGDTSPHRHRITDTYDTLDLKYLETGTRVVVRVMSDLMGGKP